MTKLLTLSLDTIKYNLCMSPMKPSQHVGPEQIRRDLQLQPYIFALLHPIAMEQYSHCVLKNHLLNFLAIYVLYYHKVDYKTPHFRIPYTYVLLSGPPNWSWIFSCTCVEPNQNVYLKNKLTNYLKMEACSLHANWCPTWPYLGNSINVSLTFVNLVI